jgi:thiamine biosynthesis lipoprotein
MRTLYLAAILGALFACGGNNPETEEQESFLVVSGSTMGTTYAVTYDATEDFGWEIDSLLQVLNQDLSTYIESSAISQFNRADSGYVVDLDKAEHFVWNCMTALDLKAITGGYFNPQVMPLVNYWGFGYEPGAIAVDSGIVDSLRLLASKNAYYLLNNPETGKPRIMKGFDEASIDFSALAKGYAVDMLANFMLGKEVENFMVDIGGEIYCFGNNPKGKPWLMGITKPKEEKNEQAVPYLRVMPGNNGMATSGNYENYRMLEGLKVVHTIDPFTGYPKASQLLSASVINQSCMMADGMATGLMAMGLESAISFSEQTTEWAIVLIYSDKEGNLQWQASEAAKQYLLN